MCERGAGSLGDGTPVVSRGKAPVGGMGTKSPDAEAYVLMNAQIVTLWKNV